MDKRQIDQHIIAMGGRGIEDELCAPLFHKVAWACGWHIAPPLIASFLVNALFFGTVSGALFGIGIALLESDRHPPVAVFLFAGPLFGVFAGVFAALYFRSKARSLGL